jgi:hypothetical protein
MKPPDEVTSQWLEAPLDDGWLVALRLSAQDGWPVVAELRVFPDEGDDRDSRWPGCWSAERLGYLAPVPPGGLTARKLREVRLETFLREQAKQLLAQRDTILRRDHATAGTDNPELTHPGRKRAGSKSDLELAQVAQEYIERCHDPRTAQRPTAALAAARAGWTTTYARDQVHAARERGLLTSLGRGRQGGTLTPKAERLLHQGATADEHRKDQQ